MQQMLSRNKRWILAVSFNTIFLLIVAALNMQFAVKLAGYITILYLAVTLLPIRFKGWKILPENANSVLMKLQIQRRDFGIASAFAVLLHVFFALFHYGGLDFGVFNPSFYFNPEILPGFIAEGILLLMLVTSHGRLTRALGKRWKPIHRLVWVAVGLAMVHTFFAARTYTPENTGIVAVIILGLLGAVAGADYTFRARQGRETAIQITTLLLFGAGLIMGLLIIALF